MVAVPSMDLTTHIVVVDRGLRELTAAFLAEHGYRVTLAQNGIIVAANRTGGGAEFRLLLPLLLILARSV